MAKAEKELRFLKDIEVYRMIVKAEKGKLGVHECLGKLKARAQESLILKEELESGGVDEKYFDPPF
ncbi:MAG: hypothetical protein ACOCTM_04735 [Bacteroidota bacterium]